MKILAIDTSSKNASVAITENEEKLIELNNADEKTHSQKLMLMIDEAFRKTGLSLEDIGLIACCLGPGSFTGVRIGIATAKAFADSKNIPAVGVNSLEELAYNLNTEGYVCSLIDAGHGNTYAGFFEIKKDQGTVYNKSIALFFCYFPTKYIIMADVTPDISERSGNTLCYVHILHLTLKRQDLILQKTRS